MHFALTVLCVLSRRLFALSHYGLVTRDKSQIAWSEIVGNNRLQACTPTAARHAGPSRLSKGVSIPRCNYSLPPICGRLCFLSVCPPPPLLLIVVKAVVVRVQRARRQRREERTRNPLDRGVVLPARGELVDAVGFERAAARPSPFRSESARLRERREARNLAPRAARSSPTHNDDDDEATPPRPRPRTRPPGVVTTPRAILRREASRSRPVSPHPWKAPRTSARGTRRQRGGRYAATLERLRDGERRARASVESAARQSAPRPARRPARQPPQ